jgi:GNAT superfamily N-acetyltransferase
LPVDSRLVPDRAHTVADTPLARVERDVRVVRYLSEGWSGVLWSDLDESCADAVIAAQVQRFSELVTPWEWKHYSYDRPTDLPDRLRAAGFTPEPTETLLVADLADLRFDTPHLRDVVIRMVTDQPGVAALVAVHHAVFDEEASALGEDLLAALQCDPISMMGVVAFAGATPIAEARIEFHHRTQFASLWGGATHPEWRRRGVYRSLVAQRAALAVSRGFRYLQVDALDSSRPILERLGFAALAHTTPYIHPGRAPNEG